MKEKLKNKKIVYTIIGIILVLLVTLAITYAYWLVTKSQTKENVISAGCLDITLTDDSAAIELIKTEPISDYDGMNLTAYEFTVTNNCNDITDYEISLETFDYANAVIPDAIKVMIDDDEPIILSNAMPKEPTIDGADKAYILKTGSISASDTKKASVKHKLRIWVDENAPISEMNKSFESQISVTVGQEILNPTLCQAATLNTLTTGNIPTGEYNNGDEYICEVMDGTFYHFFVVSSNDDHSVNLIMDRNITTGGVPATEENTGSVAWISEGDFSSIYTPNPSLTSDFRVQYGPVTALHSLASYVNNWNNIISTTSSMIVRGYMWDGTTGLMKVDDTAGATSYNIGQLKARLLTVDEAMANGCRAEINTTNDDGSVTKYNTNSCPLYLSNNLQHKEGRVAGEKVVNIQGIRGYWLLNGSAPNTGVIIHDNGSINSKTATVENHSGIRPVITVALSDLDI